MADCSRNRRPRLLNLGGMALYALVLLTAPFEHHDLVCHIKTPQHCMSCSASLLGSDPHTPAVIGADHLDDIGSATQVLPLPESTIFAARSSGRSPPADR
jgi:hypothetical protein